MSELNLQDLKNTAVNYHKYMVPSLFKPWTSTVLEQARVQPGDRVLDVACGTGVLTRAAADVTGKDDTVSGLDSNPGMLAAAKERWPGIRWEEGIAEDLPWESETFDTVVSQFGMMFFEDKPVALREMERVLKPGGRMAIAVFDSLDNIPGYSIMTDVFRRVVGKDVARALHFPFSLGDPDDLRFICNESGLAKANVTTLKDQAQFPDVQTIVLADVKGWFPIAGIELSDSQIENVIEHAESDLEEFIKEDGSLEFPVSAHLITYKKS